MDIDTKGDDPASVAGGDRRDAADLFEVHPAAASPGEILLGEETHTLVRESVRGKRLERIAAALRKCIVAKDDALAESLADFAVRIASA